MVMDKLPDLEHLSELEKDALIMALWAEVQALKARLATLEAKLQEPRKDAHNSSVPPSQTPQAHLSPGPRTRPRREARVGRAGGGRPLPPEPDHVVIAQAKIGPHGGGAVPAHAHHPPAVDETLERPPITPSITRVAPQGGQGLHWGQTSGAPVPRGMEPGTPCGASSEALATDLRSSPGHQG